MFGKMESKPKLGKLQIYRLVYILKNLLKISTLHIGPQNSVFSCTTGLVFTGIQLSPYIIKCCNMYSLFCVEPCPST